MIELLAVTKVMLLDWYSWRVWEADERKDGQNRSLACTAFCASATR